MANQVCTKCGQAKDEECFSWKSKAKGKRHSACKECFTTYSHRHYEKHRQRYLDKSVKLRQSVKEWLCELKASTPCADCGKCFPYYVMDFDHISDDKAIEISKMYGRVTSWSAIRREIAKCEIVCSNCHRMRTHRRLIEKGAAEENPF